MLSAPYPFFQAYSVRSIQFCSLHHRLHHEVEQGVAGVAIHCTTHPLSLKGVVVVEQSKPAYCEVVQNHQFRPPILRLLASYIRSSAAR